MWLPDALRAHTPLGARHSFLTPDTKQAGHLRDSPDGVEDGAHSIETVPWNSGHSSGRGQMMPLRFLRTLDF